MTSLSLKAPESVGTRDLVRMWLEAELTSDLRDLTVELDCSPLKTPTPSFFDEALKILIEERGAQRVTVSHVSPRAQLFALRSAANRDIQGKVAISDPIVVRRRAIWRLFAR